MTLGHSLHASTRVTDVLVLPQPRDTRNWASVPQPMCSLELIPCFLWHHPLWLSSPSWGSSHSTDHSSSVFRTDPSFPALLVKVWFPRGPSSAFVFFIICAHSCWWVQMGPTASTTSLWSSSPPSCTRDTHLQDINQHWTYKWVHAKYRLTNEWMKARVRCRECFRLCWGIQGLVSKEEPGSHAVFQLP